MCKSFKRKFDMIYTPYVMKLTKLIPLFILLAFFAGPLPVAFASSPDDLSLVPAIVDEKAKARDIIKRSVTVTNTSDHKLHLYPSIYDVSALAGNQGFERAEGSIERSQSLANWIEFSRGVVELGPGEEKVIPFVVRVHLDASPGTYHAQIAFAEGTTRESAEEGEPLGVTAVNIEVQADIKEVLQLNKFFTDNIFLSGDDVLFNYQIENIGNQDLKPTGEVRIYNRKGEEVAAIPANADGTAFSPDEVAQLASVWDGAQGFGKYKAFLNLDYGTEQRASVQDTVFFWIIPWKQLLGLFVASVLILVFLVFYYHRRIERRYALKYAAPSPTPDTSAIREEEVPKQKKKKRGLFLFGQKKKDVWQVAAEWTEADAARAKEKAASRARAASMNQSQTIEDSVVRATASVQVPPPPATPAPTALEGQNDTINLKELCGKPAQTAENVHHEIHVVNLKK